LVLDFIFEQDGWVLHELSSRGDHDVRVFRATIDVCAAFSIGRTPTHFQLHAPEMGGRVQYRRITFDPEIVKGATFRYSTEGWGLIQVYLGMLRDDGTLTSSHTNHNSEVRAQTWSHTYRDDPSPDEWNWAGVKRVSGKLVRFIRKLAVDKLGSRPILPAAHAARCDGRVVHLR
jgi:hypothetical protein